MSWFRSATDLRVIADYLDLPLEQLKELNPHVLRWATPPDDTEFELNLPVGYAKPYAEKVAPLPDDKRILFRHHRVSSGETLSHIARRYGVSISAITETNKISARRIIRIGQSLVIPISGITVPGDSLARVAGTTQPGPPSPPPQVYRIRRGDSLSTIAGRFGLSIGDIKEWNRMSSNLLIAGESLILRTPRATPSTSGEGSNSSPNQRLVYRVRRGDTLSKIALSPQHIRFGYPGMEPGIRPLRHPTGRSDQDLQETLSFFSVSGVFIGWRMKKTRGHDH